MKHAMAWICLMGMMLLPAGAGAAQFNKQQVKAPINGAIQNKKPVMNTATDLRVLMVHSSRCSCDLSDVDAIYLPDLMIDVANYPGNKGGVPVAAKVKISYYDLRLGRQVSFVRTLPKMNVHPHNPWALTRYVVAKNPKLVKKSAGVRVEIMPPQGITDPVPANNSKTIHKCQVMVY